MQYMLNERVNSLHELSEAHHEESSSLQCPFTKDVIHFANVIMECRNPFLENSQDFVAHDVIEQDVVIMSMVYKGETSSIFMQVLYTSD